MKTLVAFYSRTGNTKKIAEELAQKIGADVEEIVDKKNRQGVIGFFFGGKDAVQKKLTEIGETQKNPVEYDMVILGTPVWAGTMTPAVRTYVEKYKKDFKKVAFFTTQGGMREQKVFKELEALVEMSPLSKLIVTTKESVKGEYQEKLEEFTKSLE